MKSKRKRSYAHKRRADNAIGKIMGQDAGDDGPLGTIVRRTIVEPVVDRAYGVNEGQRSRRHTKRKKLDWGN